MAEEDRRGSLYQVALDRYLSLEEKQAKLQEQFHELVQERNSKLKDIENEVVDSSMSLVSEFFLSRSPYRCVLECMDHAVYVYNASSGEIIYWNHSAETLYGWKNYEIIGQRVAELLITKEYYETQRKILKSLTIGVPWSAVFNNMGSGNLRNNHDQSGANGVPGAERLNFKRIQWHPPSFIAPVPQIASSVSNLASKLLRRHTDDTYNVNMVSRDTSTHEEVDKLEKYSIFERKSNSSNLHGERGSVGRASEKGESSAEFSAPSKIVASVFAKLQMRRSEKCGKDNESVKTNDSTDDLANNEMKNKNELPGGSQAQSSHQNAANREDKEESLSRNNSSSAKETAYSKSPGYTTFRISDDSSVAASSGECHECLGSSAHEHPLLRFGSCCNQKNLKPEATNAVAENDVQKQQERVKLPSSRESNGSHASSSSKGDNESNAAGDCEIQWEDLQLGEEIGQGSYAIVYRGFWNGSDVAVKVYFGNGYTEDTLQDYRKEIDIMKRLRHPNVLLFMGAAYSQERVANLQSFCQGQRYELPSSQKSTNSA